MIVNLPLPQCAKCHHTVERMGTVYDEYRQVFRCVVYCHGAQDECEVPFVVLQDPSVSIVEARAFVETPGEVRTTSR